MTPDAPFSHRDEGTPEGDWQRAFDERMPELSDLARPFFEGLGHLVVVAAHPDDETLGAAGLLARAGASGVRVTVIVATSGEGSHPGATDGPSLARRREEEARSAVAEVDAGATVHVLRLPDGRLAEHRFALAQAIAGAVGPATMAGLGAGEESGPDAVGAHHSHRAGRHAADPGAPARADPARDDRRGATVLVAPWAGDRHPDHAAAALAARDVARAADLELLEYPIWLWHWARPADPEVPWPELRVLALDETQRAAKARAVAAHVSQVLPLGEEPGQEALLHEGMLAHFARPVEVFVASGARAMGAAASSQATAVPTSSSVPPDPDESTPVRAAADVAPAALHDEGVAAAYFDDLHRGADDPWGFESRWYEERKRAILLASLPDRRYGEVLEVGSSTGVLSRALAGRASARLVGVDVSEVATERARARNADLPLAQFERMRVPAEWPSGSFDLVVVSEVGYYLDPPDLTGLIERILGSLTPLGAVICCHWRHPVAGRSIDGDGVHAVFAERPEFARLARHLEEDFVLDVLVRAPGESVARRERIV